MGEQVVISQSKFEIESNQKEVETSVSNEGQSVSCLLCPVSQEGETRILRFIVLLLLCCIVLVILGYTINQREAISTDEFCSSKGCILTAANVLIRLNTSVDPCDDFYQFACGTYIDSLLISDDKSYITALSSTSDYLAETLEELVSKNITESDPASTRMVKNLFQSCMNEELIESRGADPLHEILKSLGGWPLIEGPQWNEPETSWVETLIKMRQIGFSTDYLFVYGISTDVKNSSWRIIELDQAKLGMPSRKYLMKGIYDKDVRAYETFQIDMATRVLGAEYSPSLKKEIEKNVQFEIDIANISFSEEARRNLPEMYNKMSIKELSKEIPGIPWLKLINGFLTINETITEDELLLVTSLEFFIKLDEMLRAATKREIQNYILWHVSASACFYLSELCRYVELDYSDKLFGVGSPAPRWKDCMDLVLSELSYGVGALYVRNIFDETSKSGAVDMVSYITKTFREGLADLKWMDPFTKRTAMKKARLMKSLIGYPNELLDEEILMKHYAWLNMSDTDLLQNMKKLSIYGFEYGNSKLREKVIKTSWKSYASAAVVNAFYSSIDNAIIFPAGILQGLFFDIERPKYMNFGAIGLIIGHEITHGFDDEGRHFDAYGNLHNWWNDETKEKFINKSQCIISQYSNFYIPEVDLYMNGEVTQGENIADNGGARVARHAYEKWKTDHGPELKLPGLNYTPEQMFWISSAHLWCSKERDEYLKLSVLSKRHSLGRFRIKGPASNSKEFSEDWGCLKDDNMNSEDKCVVW